MNNLSWCAYNYIRNQKRFNINIINNLKKFLINNKNVMNILKVNFESKNIKYSKNIYLIMSEEMENKYHN